MTETRTEKALREASERLCDGLAIDGMSLVGVRLAQSALAPVVAAARADERARLADYHEAHAVPLPHEPDGTVSATTLWQAVSNLRATIAAMKEELAQSWEHGVAQTRALDKERDNHKLSLGERDEATAVLRALVEKVHYTLNSPSMNGAMVMSAIHGMEYDGPTVAAEMLAAQRLLGMPDELPKPVYPESQHCVLHGWAGCGDQFLAFVGTIKECGDFIDKYPGEKLSLAGSPKMWSHLPVWVPPGGDRG